MPHIHYRVVVHAVIEEGPSDRIQRSLLVVGDPPLSHEECALVTVNPSIPDSLRRNTLNRIVSIIVEDFNQHVVEAKINALGVGLITFASPEIRDLLVRESPHPLDEDSTFLLVNHDEGINLRLPVFEYEAWLMFLAFPVDYLTDHYINKAVSLFGKLLLWHRPTESKSRVLVRVLLKHVRLVPHSLLVTRVASMPSNGMSWSVPVYVLNGRHTRHGLINIEDPAPPLNASPHPFSLTPLTGMQEHQLAVQRFNQQQADPRGEQGSSQVIEGGWGNWPRIPEPFQGTNMRELYGYEGPSMMDDIVPNYNVSDDAMEAWNDHVLDVERAAGAVVTGETSSLIFIRAAGYELNLSVPTLPSFQDFLSWMARQVRTRSIMPADPAVLLAEASAYFHSLIANLVEVVRAADLDTLVYSRQLSCLILLDCSCLQNPGRLRLILLAQFSSLKLAPMIMLVK
jgi:hypothetical protein